MSLSDRIAKRLQARTEAGLLRQTKVWPRADLADFSSNDYLGLRADPSLAQVFADAAKEYGLGAGASHLLGGHSSAHQQLEASLCDWTGFEAAALFASGFQAALGAFGALAGPKDLVVADRLAHACLLDGAQYAGADLRRFNHNDIARATELLAQQTAEADVVKWLVSESIFSMDGDQAPVQELVQLAKAQSAVLMIDEAHAIGVLGKQGAGLVAGNALTSKEVPVLMLTFGKALGSAGAAILGSKQTIAAIENFSRPYIYTTAMPNALAKATMASVQIAKAGDHLRERLFANIHYFRTRAKVLGLALTDSRHAIQPMLIGHTDVLSASAGLQQAGLIVPAVRAPTVPKGEQRLRVSLNAKHTQTELDSLLTELARIHDSTENFH
jgi:8-amino-7-oxononanoate synthase